MKIVLINDKIANQSQTRNQNRIRMTKNERKRFQNGLKKIISALCYTNNHLKILTMFSHISLMKLSI